MTGPEVTAAVRRVGDALTRWLHGEHADLYRPDLDAARDFLAAALNVPQMAAVIVDHLNTDTLEGDSETLVCACGHVLVTGDPDDDRDPQAEHATHHAALIRAALIGEDS
jgi:hypothetical protein